MNPKWDKPSEELISLLETLLQPFICKKRKMFGSYTFFVNGNMFAGVHEDSIFLRLSNEDRELIKKEHSDLNNFEPLVGRKMREYIALPGNFCKNISELEKWLERSFQFTSSLPVKIKKGKS